MIKLTKDQYRCGGCQEIVNKNRDGYNEVGWYRVHVGPQTTGVMCCDGCAGIVAAENITLRAFLDKYNLWHIPK